MTSTNDEKKTVYVCIFMLAQLGHLFNYKSCFGKFIIGDREPKLSMCKNKRFVYNTHNRCQIVDEICFRFFFCVC